MITFMPLQPPREHITDVDELASYQARKRKEYEDSIRKQRDHIGTWLKYAKWEAEQGKERHNGRLLRLLCIYMCVCMSVVICLHP